MNQGIPWQSIGWNSALSLMRMSLIPGQGTKIPQATRCGSPQKRKKKYMTCSKSNKIHAKPYTDNDKQHLKALLLLLLLGRFSRVRLCVIPQKALRKI